MQPVPHRKTVHTQRRQEQLTQQKDRTSLKMPPREQILPDELYQRPHLKWNLPVHTNTTGMHLYAPISIAGVEKTSSCLMIAT